MIESNDVPIAPNDKARQEENKGGAKAKRARRCVCAHVNSIALRPSCLSCERRLACDLFKRDGHKLSQP